MLPIMEGIQLFNAARGLIQEIKGNRHAQPAQNAQKTVQIPQSAFAQMLKAQLQLQAANAATKADDTTTTTTSTGPIRSRISELISQYEAELTQLREQIGSAFENSLIDTQHELDLTMDAEGNVTVANDHPDAEQINDLFAAHPMLRYGFARLASSASMIETSLDTFPPSFRYLGNPQEAVTQFGTMLTGQNNPSQFHLVLGGEGIRTYFGSESTETPTETVA